MKIFIQKVINVILRFLYIIPIKNNQVICMNFNGKGFGESPKYIAEELLKRNDDIKIYWVVNDINDDTIPNRIKKVKYKSLKYFLILYTSKIIINDTRFGIYFSKRKNQFYIQTWHGCFAMKKIENDAIEKLPKNYYNLMVHDSKMIDLIPSNSNFFNNLCKNAFLYDGNILKVGCPKDDVLINQEITKTKRVVCENLNIKQSKLLILYAPTFRNNYDNNPYDIDFQKLKKCLDNKYNKECEIIVKLHPLAIDKYKISSSDNFINANKYSDIQQLIIASDIIITDYSSVMFDGLIANKAVVIYAKDIKEYNNERGCYFKFENLPFQMATNNEELIRIIKNNDLKELKNKYERFNEKIGLIKNGNSCIKICDLIERKVKGVKDE